MDHPPQVGFEMSQMSVQPLHSPDLLKKYDEIDPGFAERVLRLAEKEQDERHHTNRLLIDLEARNTRSLNWNIIRGQFLAFGSVVVVSLLCAYFAYLGNIEAAASTAKVVIVALAAVFITGRYFVQKSKSSAISAKGAQ